MNLMSFSVPKAKEGFSQVLSVVASGEFDKERLKSFLTLSVDLLHLDSAGLYYRAEDSDLFVLAGQTEKIIGTPLPPAFRQSQGLYGIVFDTKNDTPVIADINKETQENISCVGKALLFPVFVEKNLIGILVFQRAFNHAGFTKQEIKQIHSLSDAIAFGIMNARIRAVLDSTLMKLEAVNQKLEAVKNSLNAGIIALNTSGKVLEANEIAASVFDCNLSQIIGNDWWTLIESLPEFSREVASWIIAETIEGRPVNEVIQTKQSKIFRVCSSILPNGSIIVVMTDITQEIQKERELDRNKRLAEIGQMAASIAHEIRNPLTSISGAAQLIRSGAECQHVSAWTQVIEEEARGLDTLCNDFLNFSKPLELKKTTTNINALFCKIMTLFQAQFSKSQVQANLHVCPSAPIVFADPARLIQVFRNLLQNSLQAISENGTLNIKITSNEHNVFIQIEDNGCGMSEKDVEQAFVPFFTTKPQGTGLGLPLVRKIIEGHGGTVELQSQKGIGTTVTVSLPLRGGY